MADDGIFRNFLSPFSLIKWCSGRDSNPHGLLHTPLKRARLPITPPEPVFSKT